MPRKKSSKKKKLSSRGFFGTIVDYLTAVLVLAVVGGIIYYWFFGGKTPDPTEKISEFYENAKQKLEDTAQKNEKPSGEQTEGNADIDDIEITIGDITPEDEMMMQYEMEQQEMLADNTETPAAETAEQKAPDAGPAGSLADFSRNVDFFADKYTGLALKEGADPDKDFATDNSHLICSVIGNAAELSGKKFAGYMQMDALRTKIHNIELEDIRTGDLLQLKSGMLGLITHHKNSDDFMLTYASQNKGSVISIDMTKMKYYWLRSENFKGFYRFNDDVLR